MGRLPKPKILHDQSGNASNRVGKNIVEPTAPSNEPTLPTYLKGEAKKCWIETVDSLRAMGLLSSADAKSIERYANCYGRYRKAMDDINKNGSTILHPSKDQQMSNPACHEANNCASQMEKMEKEFGLTPVARAKLRMEQNQVKPVSKFGKFLGKSA